MLDLKLLQDHHLATVPWMQLLVANAGLFFDYRVPRRTKIVVEGAENLPSDRGVFLAMNHTDRYNYWPLQYWMYRNGHRFTATWIKGKYVEKALAGRFLLAANNIPVPSRGFVIAKEFKDVVGRAPDEAEYRILRDLVDDPDREQLDLPAEASKEIRQFVEAFGGGEGPASFSRRFGTLFDAMMAEIVRLTREALEEKRLNVLVFPQGTRSKSLSRGHIGLAQVAQHLGHAIVPVGCSGSDLLYPGSSPFSKGGRVTYRFGKAIRPDDPAFAEHRVPASVVPFSRESREHTADYQAITDVVMDRINDLVDPEYQYSEDGSSDGVKGVNRFL